MLQRSLMLQVFKLCRNQKDGNRVRRKIESCSSEAKIVRIEAERRKNFSKPTEKVDKWTILCVGGENRAADLNSARKRPHGSGLSN